MRLNERRMDEFDDAHDGRPDRHDEEGREQAEHQRKDELRADLRGQLLGALHALVAEFLRVDAQGVADAGSELERLDQQADEPPDVLEPGSEGERLERRFAFDAGTHLGSHACELHAEVGVAELQLVRHSLERRRQAEARLDADYEQVERIRESVTQALLAPLDHVVQHVIRKHEADERRQHGEEDQLLRGPLWQPGRGGQHGEQQGQRKSRLDRVEERQGVGRAQAGIHQPLLHGVAVPFLGRYEKAVDGLQEPQHAGRELAFRLRIGGHGGEAAPHRVERCEHQEGNAQGEQEDGRARREDEEHRLRVAADSEGLEEGK
jgi:hypothetical protein